MGTFRTSRTHRPLPLQPRCNHAPNTAAPPTEGAAAKLRSTAGESISEVLVSMLIVGLALVLFVTMVNVATSMSTESSSNLQYSYDQLSSVDAAADQGEASVARATTTITVSGTALNATFTADAYTATPAETSDGGHEGGTYTRYELQGGE